MPESLIDLTEIPEDLEAKVDFLQGRIAEMKQYYFDSMGGKIQVLLLFRSEEIVYGEYGWIAARYVTIPFEDLKDKPYEPLFKSKKLIDELGRKIVEFYAESTEDKKQVRKNIVRICQELINGPGMDYDMALNQYIRELKRIPGFENEQYISKNISG